MVMKMTTSTENLALAIAEGRASHEETAQAERDTRIGALVTEFRELISALDGAREQNAEPPEALQHWARVWAHEAAPHRPSLVSRLLEVLAYGAPCLTAVRGAAAGGPAVLYGDNQYQLDVRLEPEEDGTHRVRGQVVPATETVETGEGPWSIQVIGPPGVVLRTLSDEHGEFRFDGVHSVTGLSLVAERGSERLIVPRLAAPPGAVEPDGNQTGNDR